MAAVKISEVNLIKDYVALTNNSNSAINLRNWHIIDITPTNQKRHEFIFKKDFFLAANTIVKIWSGVGKDNANNIYQNRRASIWNNTGDTATLYDSNGNEVDELKVGLYKIYGTVKDKESSEGISGATVAIYLRSINTQPDGSYKLENVSSGYYQITASKEGYGSRTKNVKVSGADIAVNFELKKGEAAGKGNVHVSVDDKNVPNTKLYKEDYRISAVLKNDGNVPILDWGYKFLERDGKKEWKKEEEKKWKTIGADYSDEDKTVDSTWTVESDKLNHSWQWYHTDWLGAHKDQLEKIYYYRTWLGAERRSETMFDFETTEPEYLGKTKVRVSDDKQKAHDYYNLAFFGGAAATVIAAIATLGGSLLVTAAVAALGYGGVAALLSLIDSWMRDPFILDKSYKKIKKAKVLSTKMPANIIKNIKSLDTSITLNRDKYWTAIFLNDKPATSKAKAELKHQFAAFEKQINKIAQFASKQRPRLKKIKVDTRFAKSILRNKLPQKLSDNLSKAGFTRNQIKNYRRLILAEHASKIRYRNAYDLFKIICHIGNKLAERNKTFLR